MTARAGLVALILLLSSACTTDGPAETAAEPAPQQSAGGASETELARSDGGPLATDGSGTGCSWNPSPVYVYGDDILETSEPIQIESVELVNGQGLEIVSAWTMPTGDVPFSGSWVVWPLPKDDVGGDNGIQWDQRERAEGAELDPGRRYNFLVRLKRLTAPGRQGFDAVRVSYRTSDRSYFMDTEMVMSFRKSRKACP